MNPQESWREHPGRPRDWDLRTALTVEAVFAEAGIEGVVFDTPEPDC
jgi:hypothetical protein